MKRIRFLAPLLLFALACATANNSALNQAKLAYVDASLTYETTMQTLTTLRANHQLTDAQWARVQLASSQVRAAAPAVRTALDLWESVGTEPQSYPQVIAAFANALGKVLVALQEVPR